MRRLAWLVLFLLCVSAPAGAAEPKCPLDLATCLAEFGRMRERPWLGVSLEQDSLGRPHIQSVTPGSPAARAGLRPGDVIENIERQVPRDWFAGKAGWKTGPPIPVAVLRDGRETQLTVPREQIPEELFAKRVGTHMIEGHLAYMGKPEDHETHEAH